MRKIKILVITYLPWREDNNIGNSYSNIFKDTLDKYEFAHVYVRNGMPQNSLAKEYYHISIIKIIKKFFGYGIKVGERLPHKVYNETEKIKFSSSFNLLRLLRWQIFFVIEDLFGLSKSWKTDDFDQFIDDFDPDLVFGTLPDNPLIYNIMLYIKDRKNIPLVTYPWDDYYSLDHANLSPFFWIHKFMQRRYLKKTGNISEYLYVITNLMKQEYEQIFKKECKLLFKGYEFKGEPKIKKIIGNPIRLIYMGNIGQGRWKTLALLASAIKEINTDGQKMILNVYTLSPSNGEIKRALNIEGCSKLNKPIPNEEKQSVMDHADILVHAEPFKKSEFQFYRASFTTKIVDYFYASKCIMAIGGITASTDYLIRNDAAICITEKNKVVDELNRIVSNKSMVTEYARKSWDCGVRNHQIKEIQNRMYIDFLNLIKNDNQES